MTITKDHGQFPHLEESTATLEMLTAPPVSSYALARNYLAIVAFIISPLAALMIWLSALLGANPNNMSDLGLISVLPPIAFVALLLLFFSFSFALRQEPLRAPILLLHTLILIFMLYGAAFLIEGTPRTGIAWRLMGITDYVIENGAVDPTQDAFQNWPGFYFLAAFLTSVSGIENPLTLAGWAHVLFNLLYLSPLLLVFRTATQDKRLIWLGVWFFYLTNWIGQDYLSPQAFGYLIYLVTLGILLNWFRTAPAGSIVPGEPLSAPARFNKFVERLSGRDKDVSRPVQPGLKLTGLMAIILVLVVVLIPSHQLTPVVLLVSVTALVLFRRITPRGLPVILVVLIIGWISYMAVPFLSGHVDLFTKPFGALTSNVSENVVSRVRGSPDHIFIVFFRMYVTASICILAALGCVRRIRNKSFDINFILLAWVPFPLLALQTYGGELLLRIYLFALPFLAFFVAALFLPKAAEGFSRQLSLVIFSVSAILGVAFFFMRYGNERMDYFRPGEIAALRYVYATSEPGSQLVAGTPMLPWGFKEYNSHTYTVVNRLVRDNDLDQLAVIMDSQDHPASYLILTRSQKASAELLYGWEPGTWESFEASLIASDKFKRIFENPDASIYVLTSQSGDKHDKTLYYGRPAKRPPVTLGRHAQLVQLRGGFNFERQCRQTACRSMRGIRVSSGRVCTWRSCAVQGRNGSG